MALQKRIGLGVTLGVDTTLGGSNYAVLGNIVNAIRHSGTKAVKVDISLLTDTFNKYAKGPIDPGEWSFVVAWDPLDTNTSSKLTTLHEATGVNSYNWQIILPAIVPPGTNTIAYSNFAAHLIGLGAESEKEKMLVMPVTIAITGDPDL